MLESLKCEVIVVVVWLSAYPSFVRWILCWLCALPLSEVVFERRVVYSRLFYLPKFLVEVPCVGSPVRTS